VYFYTQNRLLIDFTYPLMSTTAIYLTLIFSSFVREQAQRRQIRSALGRYAVAGSGRTARAVAGKAGARRRGARDDHHVLRHARLHLDLETYKNDPQGLTALMNRFLTPLTNAILNRKGTIDKYMGDAIMAFWNAPLDDKDHQLNACEAALDMLERVDELNQAREQEAKEEGRRSFRSMSASASIPAPAWSATWAPISASTIRCSATASTWPRASKANPRNTAFRSSSAPGPRWRSRTGSRSSNSTSSW
jgi:hypothetical protein